MFRMIGFQSSLCSGDAHMSVRACPTRQRSSTVLKSISTLASSTESPRSQTPPTPPEMKVSDSVHTRNKILADKVKGELILGPLTRGGNLPYRRLCADFGAKITMSEMVFSRMLLKGNRAEKARLKRADNEEFFGVQFATNSAAEGIATAKVAAEAGADWVDLNCGCPIFEATRRGLGCMLLRKPNKLAKLVNMISEGSPIPLTVKIRTGESASKINAEKVVRLLESAGAAFVTIHGRTSQQRYKKPADWDLMGRIASDVTIPVIGNGDVLTYYEADRRMAESEFHAVMAARGALIKPWIFQEYEEKREMLFSQKERVEIYRRLAVYMKEHFQDDARGKKMAFYFLPWHFDFLCRYRHLPQSDFETASLEKPLLQTRWTELQEPIEAVLDRYGSSGGDVDDSLLGRLLACELGEAHLAIAEVLWESGSDGEAVIGLEKLASENLKIWEEESRAKEFEEKNAQG
ncbi:hypothetical protein BSKO_08864 [Bryopsis sp. KO-2023]|nr:hypothetical protein BSKO_08864 [Bryopsis sp. KO-2023]